MSPHDPRLAHLGDLLRDRYQVEALIGRGGSATVYRVRNLRLGRVEALKVLAESDEDADFAARFTHEAQVAASLDHPSIVKVYDFGHGEGLYWYSMQLVQGPTLARQLRERGPMPEALAARLALPLLEALEYSHQRDVIHRDIKPGNIILDMEGRPYLMDFGVAKSAASLLRTRTGLLLGTPAYVAPEQASAQPLDRRADLYSFGVTLYEMVSGDYPFRGEDPLQVVVVRLTEPPEPLTCKLPGVNPAFAAIVMRALARDREARFATAAEMRAALLDFVASAGPPAPLELAQPLPALTVTTGRSLPELRTEEDAPNLTRAGKVPHAAGTRWPRHWSRNQVLAGAAALLLLAAAMLAVVWGIPLFTPEATGVSRPRVAARAAATPQPATPLPTALPPSPSAVAERRPSTPPTPAPTQKPRPFTSPNVKSVAQATLPASLAGVCGGQSIHVKVVVGEDGRARSAEAVGSPSPECGEAARAAALQFAYEPGRDVAGAAVEAPLMIAVSLEATGGEVNP